MSQKIRIVLADDHNLVRAGLKSLLEDVADFEVVGDAASGDAALKLVGELVPDVLLLDIAMPGLTGLQVLQRVRESMPGVKVVMVSMLDNEEHIGTALRLGAAGYVLKHDAPDELEGAIRRACAGGVWLSRSVERQVVDNYVTRTAEPGRRAELTGRQLEVLKMIADGLGTRNIAEALGLSIKTVEAFRAQIMRKLEIDDVAGLVRYAIKRGISDL